MQTKTKKICTEGIIMTSSGTISVARTIPNRILSPLKWYLANA